MTYKIVDQTSTRGIAKRLAVLGHPIAAGIIDRGESVECGDMLWLRDLLIENKYKLWRDFSIRKMI